MTIKDIFENRSGRVIALFRVVLVLVFLVAVLIEPVARQTSLDLGRTLLWSYLLVSVGAAVVAWRSWWFDQQFAPFLLVLDVLVFMVAVFVTESANADFTSPFLALFALAVLSATLRWDWRVAAGTGIAATALFVLVGFTIWGLGLPLDVFRFGRRGLYMLALLLVLVWVGVQRRDPYVPPPDLVGEDGPIGSESEAQLRWQALAYAMAVTGARRGVLAWSDAEEPWLDLHIADPARKELQRLGPDEIPDWEEGADEVRLFDLPRSRKLVRNADSLPSARILRAPMALAAHLGLAEGLTLPLRCISGSGVIVLSGIPGPGADFLALGSILARELSNAIDRTGVMVLEREAMLSRTRGAIARDLHDSVAQSLAGACFRLEALRRTQPQGSPVDGELATIRDALRREQDHVRALIETLRSPASPPQPRQLEQDLRETASDAAVHWNVTVDLTAPQDTEVPGWYSHELQQLLREAVANAAKHGRASRVTVSVQRAGQAITLVIVDNGSGFNLATSTRQPWSIRERVAALGGNLEVDSDAQGTRLSIILPAGTVGAAA